MEEVKGRKKRETKLGIKLAMITAKMESTRVCGESFRLSVVLVLVRMDGNDKGDFSVLQRSCSP